jgi:small subunit ribosomal protein S15
VNFDAAAKAKIVKENQRDKQDTGSPEVQIALITGRMKSLSGHFKEHKHDFHSRLGLLKLVSQRNKLLKYLRRASLDRFRALIERLNIRDKWST